MASASDWVTEACLVWKTEKPFDICPRNSPVFTLKDCEYWIHLENKFNYYYLYLQKKGDQEDDVSGPFDISIFFMDETNKCLCEPKRTDAECDASRCFWMCNVFEVAKKRSDFLPLRFVFFRFIFHGVSGAELRIESKGKSEGRRGSLHLDKQLCLDSLSRDFSKLLEADSNHDVELTCEGRTFKSHRNVLSTRSEVFSAMLGRSGMAEGRTGRVQVKDMNVAVFQEFLRYLYTGKLQELTLDTAKLLYEAGDRYAVDQLKKRCSGFLTDSLTQENACEILTFADRHSDSNLSENVIAYILDEKIPLQDDHWSKFRDDHPKLAVDVLHRFYQSNCPK